jgi:hypothetical protein
MKQGWWREDRKKRPQQQSSYVNAILNFLKFVMKRRVDKGHFLAVPTKNVQYIVFGGHASLCPPYTKQSSIMYLKVENRVRLTINYHHVSALLITCYTLINKS